mmetsp:Transcript_16999/g.25383  ORF Transcript_16999/g.25383 Transcript_16999/m.25383 type:complete len:295 (+) Transcript_16999:87-971(+)
MRNPFTAMISDFSSSLSAKPVPAEENDENHRETTIFIKVLLKFLSVRDSKMYKEAKRVILSCLKKNDEHAPEYQSLSASLLSHLRKLIGGSFWKEAEIYFVKYLREKESMSASQAESAKDQVAVKAAVAYSALIRRNQMRRALVVKNLHHVEDEEQKFRSDRTFSCSSPPPSILFLPSKRKRSIKFDKVTIREYEVTAGDNPSCSSGVPIALGWKYNPVDKEVAIDEYEKCNATRGNSNAIQLSAEDRYTMLAIHGVPNSQITEAHEECQRVQKERRETINTLIKLRKTLDNDT